jgi:hypothetical protein
VPSNGKRRRFIRQWRKRYPFPVAWVSNGANRLSRKSEVRWFAQFEGADQLKRKQVVSLIEWRFAGDATTKERALGGVTGPRHSGHAKRCIKKALGTANATAALDTLLEDGGGIPGWGPEMASVVLAACRPDTYLVADHRALCALRGLHLYTSGADDEFIRADWWPYLRICRKLAVTSGVSLREVGYALRAAGDNAPELPVPPTLGRTGNGRRRR